MIALFLIVFLGGLLIGVRTMLVGVERRREVGATEARSFRMSPAVLSVAAIIFGAAGYVMERAGLEPMYAAIGALALAVVAGVATAHAVKRWWADTPENEEEDERYVLQGQFARVTESIGDRGEGEVAFEVGTTHRVVRARNISEGAVAAGVDVVIERIEDDIAYVEAWEQVEKRI